jgi:hypothetical protein
MTPANVILPSDTKWILKLAMTRRAMSLFKEK